MQAVMKKLGHIKSEEEAKEMIAAYDKDKGGTIDFHEYLLLLAEATKDEELCAPRARTFRRLACCAQRQPHA